MQYDFWEQLDAFQHDDNVKVSRDKWVKDTSKTGLVKLADEVLAYRKELPRVKSEITTLRETTRRLNEHIAALGNGTNEELISKVAELTESLSREAERAAKAEEANIALQKKYEQSMMLSGAQQDFLAGLLRKHGIW
jgi:predicted  nucleic acid-binding Zn-ribbon protein